MNEEPTTQEEKNRSTNSILFFAIPFGLAIVVGLMATGTPIAVPFLLAPLLGGFGWALKWRTSSPGVYIAIGFGLSCAVGVVVGGIVFAGCLMLLKDFH